MKWWLTDQSFWFEAGNKNKKGWSVVVFRACVRVRTRAPCGSLYSFQLDWRQTQEKSVRGSECWKHSLSALSLFLLRVLLSNEKKKKSRPLTRDNGNSLLLFLLLGWRLIIASWRTLSERLVSSTSLSAILQGVLDALVWKQKVRQTDTRQLE